MDIEEKLRQMYPTWDSIVRSFNSHPGDEMDEDIGTRSMRIFPIRTGKPSRAHVKQPRNL